MKAVRNTENGIDVLDVPFPKGDGVVINVRSAGICGSDLSAVQHGHLFPHTMGHELAGYCEDGRAVAIEPVIPCDDCDQCHSQNYNRCRAQFDTFVAFSCDGGMAEQIRLPERCLLKGETMMLSLSLRGVAKAPSTKVFPFCAREESSC